MSEKSSQRTSKKSKKSFGKKLLKPIHSLISKKVAAIHRRLFDWHCRTFFPLDEHLSERELAYLETCFSMALGFSEIPEGSDYEEYSYFTYSHRVEGEKVNSSRFAYGSMRNPEAALEKALPVLEERGLSVDPYFLEDENSDFYGLGWDFLANQFKVYFRIVDFDKMPVSEFRELIQDELLPNRRSEGLVAYTFVEDQIHERKVYLYPQPEAEEYEDIFPGTKGRVLMVTTKRGVITQYDVSKTKTWAVRLNETGQRIIEQYKQQNYTLDTIAMTDRDHFTLYFPGAYYPFLKHF